MDREEALRKIEELKEFIEKEGNQIDFSKWIGRYMNMLAIRGEKQLISGDNDIYYMRKPACIYNNPINYEVVRLHDLKIGDVFIGDSIESPVLTDFNIFIGRDNDGDFITQYLGDVSGIEYINNKYYISSSHNKKVKRFLRR